MPFDAWENELDERRNRRSRLVRCVRGWLWEKRHPRVKAVAMLAVAGGCGCALAAWLGRHGFGWTARAALGSLSAWPMYLLFVLAVSAREAVVFARELEIGRFRSADDLAEGRRMRDDALESGMSRIMEHKGDDIRPHLLMILATLGLWLLWQVVWSAPTLMAETIVDKHLSKTQPHLVHRVQILDWRLELFGGTALYFTAFSAVAGLLTAIVSIVRDSAG